MLGQVLTISQAADELGVTRDAVYNLITRKRLPATRVGSVWLIERTDLDAYRASVAHKKRPGPKSEAA